MSGNNEQSDEKEMTMTTKDEKTQGKTGLSAATR